MSISGTISLCTEFQVEEVIDSNVVLFSVEEMNVTGRGNYRWCQIMNIIKDYIFSTYHRRRLHGGLGAQVPSGQCYERLIPL